MSKNIVIKDIKKIFGNKIDFINSKAKFIDFNKNYIEIEKNKVKINYDILIMSQGSSTNFFGNKNIENNTIDYKNYNSVLRIKNKIKNNVRKYSKTKKKELLTFAVIGAGLTGVELICSLRESAIKEIKKYSNISSKDVKVLIIQEAKTIVPKLPNRVRLIIEKYLINNNIEIMTNTIVKCINKAAIKIKKKKGHENNPVSCHAKTEPSNTGIIVAVRKGTLIALSQIFKDAIFAL